MHKKIQDLIKNLKQNKILEKLIYILKTEHNLILNIGCEIEFYCNNLTDAIFINLSNKFPQYKFKKEKGNFQFEYEIFYTKNLFDLSHEIEFSIKFIKEFLSNYNLTTLFTPKPHKDDYGNAMQFHISFEKKIMPNINFKTILDGFLNYLEETFVFYAHYEEDYLRFCKKFLSPTHVSYGFNNRTCALRIINRENWHFEHRVPSPISSSYLCLCTILKTAEIILKKDLFYKKGNLSKNFKNYNEIYGNAFDKQYDLACLPLNLNDAMNKCNFKFFDI